MTINLKRIFKYMPTAESRQAYATEIAINNGIEIDDNGRSCWWIRCDKSATRILPVLNTGKISNYAIEDSKDYVGVRPAMWVSLSPNTENMYADEIIIDDVRQVEIIEFLNSWCNEEGYIGDCRIADLSGSELNVLTIHLYHNSERVGFI